MLLVSPALVRSSHTVACCPSHLSRTYPPLGKTTWLLYALIRALYERKPVGLYTGSYNYLFLEQGVFIANGKLASNAFPAIFPRICVLIDLDTSTDEGLYLHTTTSVYTYTVIACSPNPLRYKHLMRNGKAEMFFMPLWTGKELSAG